jgi:MFS family permease
MTKNIFKEAVDGLKEFTPSERRNIILYITGIMIYKFGLEAFNGSIVALATNRYDYDAFLSGTTSKTFERVGLLTGLNQAMQCVGSIIIAPLIKRYPTKNVLSGAIIVFAIFTAVLLIVDAAAGGSWIPDAYKGLNHPDDKYVAPIRGRGKKKKKKSSV